MASGPKLGTMMFISASAAVAAAAAAAAFAGEGDGDSLLIFLLEGATNVVDSKSKRMARVRVSIDLNGFLTIIRKSTEMA